MSRIVVVDDERNVLAAFTELLSAGGHDVVTFRGADEALTQLQATAPDLIVIDIRMPGMDGLEALRRIKAESPRLPVIVMTGQGTMETAVEATKLGAFDYHLKPFDPADMLQTIERALAASRLMKGHVALDPRSPAPAEDAIIGHSPVMQEVYKAIGRVAPTDATVLIRGESGTGKELIARAIYQHSRRADAPLMVVNCVALPETLLESELFGHERGSFTGAHARRIGKLEQASGGTIFLDEIGDISAGVQAKILRVLQERSFERLGGNQLIHVDVRLITATNRNLEKAMAEGGFREDLYHRLNVVTVDVPPLRARREDIPALVQYFILRFARELESEPPPLADGALRLLAEHPWPGNVRELEHCIQRVMIFRRGYAIQEADVSEMLDRGDQDRGGDRASPDDGQLAAIVHVYLRQHAGEGACEQFLAKVEKLLLEEALRRTGGNQTHAAKLLGLPRPTFHARIERHGLLSEKPEPPSNS